MTDEQIIEMLMEGGNSVAKDRETGEVKQMAHKMDLSRVNRSHMKNALLDMFSKLNDLFKKEYKRPLWNDFSVVKSGLAFNGSSTYMFDDTISDEEFTKYKPKVGDVDVIVSKENGQDLFDLLAKYEDKKIGELVYLGNPKAKLGNGHQINGVFKYEVPGTDYTAYPQVDFELMKYNDDNTPDTWAKFSHNSDWNDIKAGFKGVNHKYAMVNLARVLSSEVHKFPKVMLPKGASRTAYGIITGSSGVLKFIQDHKSNEKIEFRVEDVPKSKSKKAKDEYESLEPKYTTIKEFVNMSEDEVKHTIASHVYLTGKKYSRLDVFSKSSKFKMPTFLAFSVDKGVRVKFSQVLTKDGEPVAVDKKTMFIEESSKTATYTQDLKTIFELFFGFEPSKSDLNDMNSFIGVIELLKKGKYENKKKIYSDFLTFLIDQSLWKNILTNPEKQTYSRAQELERDSMEEDARIKWAMVNYIIKELGLENMRSEVENKAKYYYDHWQGGAGDDIMESKIIYPSGKLSEIFEMLQAETEKVLEPRGWLHFDSKRLAEEKVKILKKLNVTDTEIIDFMNSAPNSINVNDIIRKYGVKGGLEKFLRHSVSEPSVTKQMLNKMIKGRF